MYSNNMKSLHISNLSLEPVHFRGYHIPPGFELVCYQYPSLFVDSELMRLVSLGLLGVRMEDSIAPFTGYNSINLSPVNKNTPVVSNRVCGGQTTSVMVRA